MKEYKEGRKIYARFISIWSALFAIIKEARKDYASFAIVWCTLCLIAVLLPYVPGKIQIIFLAFFGVFFLYIAALLTPVLRSPKRLSLLGGLPNVADEYVKTQEAKEHAKTLMGDYTYDGMPSDYTAPPQSRRDEQALQTLSRLHHDALRYKQEFEDVVRLLQQLEGPTGSGREKKRQGREHRP